jgi:hypothetical protein
MLGRLAKGAYVLFVAAMIVAWAASAGKSTPSTPKNDEPVVWTFNA